MVKGHIVNGISSHNAFILQAEFLGVYSLACQRFASSVALSAEKKPDN